MRSKKDVIITAIAIFLIALVIILLGLFQVNAAEPISTDNTKYKASKDVGELFITSSHLQTCVRAVTLARSNGDVYFTACLEQDGTSGVEILKGNLSHEEVADIIAALQFLSPAPELPYPWTLLSSTH